MLKLLTAFSIVSVLALSCAAQTESLLIGPGDRIRVEVIDTPELAQQARVSDSGTVSLAYIGEIKLAGQTAVAAAKTIETALISKQFMRNPQVRVTVDVYATQEVSVLGEVKSVGTVSIGTPQPILKVLALAGGLTDMADRHITIERHSDNSQRIQYYLANDAQQALSESVVVYPGDTVVVPRAPVVYIMGDVGRPGGYSMTTADSHLTILQAIALAGSANKTSRPSRIRLIRKASTGSGQEEVPIQLADIQKGKQPDILLQPNDIIYVPFSWMKNVAIGSATIAASTSSAAIYAAH